MRRENKNILTLREYKILGKGLRIKDQTVVGGESSHQMEPLISHRESIILCSHPARRHLVSVPPFWCTVKKEILCMNRERSFLSM